MSAVVKTDAPEELLLQQLCVILNGYLEPKQITSVISAYHLADQAHYNQFRKSGEPYICHPISVAIILAKMRMDACGITVAILHDVLEDTEVSKDQLTAQFGSEVAELVDGVTK